MLEYSPFPTAPPRTTLASFQARGSLGPPAKVVIELPRMEFVMTRRAENERFTLDRCHLPPPRWHSSPPSPPDVLPRAHMMSFGMRGRAAGFAYTRSHSALQLRRVDARRRRSIIEDCLGLSLQRQATKLDLDGRFPSRALHTWRPTRLFPSGPGIGVRYGAAMTVILVRCFAARVFRRDPSSTRRSLSR